MLEVFTNIDSLPTGAGFVPTMGHLHEGHLSLVRRSLAENKQSVVSIFVNPKQFGEGEDYARYPRTLEEDVEKLKALGGRIKLFAPSSPAQIYPPGFGTTIVPPACLTSCLCGPSRPGHFAGVATVLYLLFKRLRPSVAYFGQKDYQQFKVIQRMVCDLRLPVQLRLSPTVRDEHGLALSSRNDYLLPEQYPQALLLYQTLQRVGERLPTERAALWTGRDSRWEYLELLDAATLSPLGEKSSKALVAGALRLGSTRLIDNVIVDLC